MTRRKKAKKPGMVRGTVASTIVGIHHPLEVYMKKTIAGRGLSVAMCIPHTSLNVTEDEGRDVWAAIAEFGRMAADALAESDKRRLS